MGKLAQIAKTSNSSVVLLKEEGYKNKEIASRLGLSEASVSRILKKNKKKLDFITNEKEWPASEDNTTNGPKITEAFARKTSFVINRYKKISF